jgi:hypothetical protein
MKETAAAEGYYGDSLDSTVYWFREYRALSEIALIKVHFFHTNNNVKCMNALST